jgi:hypothetical protein
MELISEMPGAKLDQRDRHGKTPIDIAYICKSKYVGLFLADKVPHTNMYSWDTMYDTPYVEYRAEDDQDNTHFKEDRAATYFDDDQVDTHFGDDLIERNARRQKLRNEEHMQVQMQYPPHLWALDRPIRVENDNKKEGTKKSSR